MEKIEKNILGKKEVTTSTVIKLFSETYPESSNLSDELIKRLLEDIDISSALDKVERGVASRKLLIQTDDIALEEKAKEIEKRFSGIKFNRILNHMITARYWGYSCFEIIYNEDFSINTLIPIPYDYVTYKASEKEWKIKIGSNEIPLNREKFLLCIHRWNPARPTGTNIFESCKTSFLDKEMYQRQLRGLSKKYGDVIIVFPYDENTEFEDIKEQAEQVANMKGQDVVAIPVGRNQSLKDSFQFIKLSDLQPEIYTELENREKEKLIQKILGGTLTINNGSGVGSYSLGEIHQQGLEDVIQEVCNFCTDSLYQLIEIDSHFFGYDPNDFTWTLEKVYSEEEMLEKDRKKEEKLSLKLENMQKLSNIGYKLTKSYLAEFLGIDEDLLEESPVPMSNGFLRGEFSKNKLDELLERVKEQDSTLLKEIEDSFGEFFKDISSQLKEKLKNIKSLEDLNSIDLDMSSYKDKMLISFLKGITDDMVIAGELTLIEEDINPFKIKPDKAIQYFINKAPILFEKLDEISAKVQENYFYIKKSTSLEVTKALYNNLLSTLDEGKTFKDWLKMSENILNKTGFGDNPWYLELVYRNNLMTTYNAGTFYNQELNKKNKPYGMYDSVGDNRTSDLCRSLDGLVYLLDHSFWKSFLPPNHHGCRSRRIALSKDDVKEYGLTIHKTMGKAVLDLKDELGEFKGNQVNALATSLKKKSEKVKELKKEVESTLKQLSLME